MENHESQQQASSEPRLKLPHHDRPGIADKQVSEKPPTLSQSHAQPRRKSVISPPPLKRQRTTSGKPNSTIRKAGLSTDPSAITHSFNEHVVATSNAQSNRNAGIIPVSKSFPAPTAPQPHVNRNARDISGRRHVSQSRKPSKSGSFPKATCLICDKSSATSYNPIVACSGCSRSYHDSCRKPPLAPGTNPLQWRCSACLSDIGTRKPSSMSLAPAPASHSVVRELLKPRFAHRAPNAVPPDRVPEAVPEKHVEPEIVLTTPSDATSVNLNKPKDVLGSSRPLEPKLLERTEVPNTPSQPSSQLDGSIPEHLSENLPNARVCQQNSSTQDDEDASALDDPSHTQNQVPFTALCSGCRIQIASVKAGEKDAQCVRCRTKSRIAETCQQEIPETPNVDTARRHASLLPTSSSNPISHPSAARLGHQEVETIPSTRVPPMSEGNASSTTAKTSPLSQFNPDRATIIADVGKIRDDDLSGLSSAVTKALVALVASRKTSLEQNAPIEVTSIAETLGQKTMSRPNEIKSKSSSSNNASVPQVNEPRERSVQPAETSDLDDLAGTSGPHVFHPGSTHSSDLLGEDEARNPASTVPEPIEVGTHISSNHPSKNGLPDRSAPAAAMEQESAASKSNETVEEDSNISESPIEAHSGPSILTKRHTNRELARIALVCANGTGMTALEIIDWLALRFSYLKKGQGGWEKSVKSVLSFQPEFCGAKPSGRPYERIVYNFTSTANRAKYEEEYHEYLPLASVLGPQDGHGKARKSAPQRSVADDVMQPEEIQDEQPTQTKRRITRAIKSAPSRRNAMTDDSLPTPLTKEITTDAEPGFNPFERATVSRPTRAPLDNLEAQRGTDFRSAYSPNTAPSIETMTSEEKAAKIAEIKARPSRKQFFGANWRLAHVRRYGREDIHDESDGAWKSRDTTETPMADRNPAMNDRDENQSLLQVFNLPANTRPFSDGNELVFRNVTSVNGRLPRSRQAYRVGKVFGGELTIN